MEKKLQRNEKDKMLAGVCAGLADYFDVDVTWIRIAFVVATMAGFSGILAYIILWIAVPAKPYIPGSYDPGSGRYNADYRVYEDKAPPSSYTSNTVPEPPQSALKARRSGNGRMIAGLIMVGFGAFFLLDEFNVIPYWFDFDKLWPLIFIIPGILIISKNGKKRNYDEQSNINYKEASNIKTDDTTSASNTTSTNATGPVTTQEEPKL